jgi:hypothetical protein
MKTRTTFLIQGYFSLDRCPLYGCYVDCLSSPYIFSFENSKEHFSACYSWSLWPHDSYSLFLMDCRILRNVTIPVTGVVSRSILSKETCPLSIYQYTGAFLVYGSLFNNMLLIRIIRFLAIAIIARLAPLRRFNCSYLSRITGSL